MIEVMAALGPEERSATAIAEGMGFAAVTQAAATAQRLDTARGLIERGRPYRFRHRAVEAFLTSSWPEVSA
jgi:hypothetical protein